MSYPGDRTTGRRVQYAALPYRIRHDGEVQVRLITSRETRRWVLPKGWPMKHLSPAKAAARETYEEAGLMGSVAREPLGMYTYEKRLGTRSVLCDVLVFPLKVKRHLQKFPEQAQRFGFWFTVESAAAAVQEEELKALILTFGDLVARKREEASAKAQKKRAARKATTAELAFEPQAGLGAAPAASSEGATGAEKSVDAKAGKGKAGKGKADGGKAEGGKARGSKAAEAVHLEAAVGGGTASGRKKPAGTGKAAAGKAVGAGKAGAMKKAGEAKKGAAERKSGAAKKAGAAKKIGAGKNADAGKNAGAGKKAKISAGAAQDPVPASPVEVVLMAAREAVIAPPEPRSAVKVGRAVKIAGEKAASGKAVSGKSITPKGSPARPSTTRAMAVKAVPVKGGPAAKKASTKPKGAGAPSRAEPDADPVSLKAGTRKPAPAKVSRRKPPAGGTRPRKG